jgi:hypothetical protein
MGTTTGITAEMAVELVNEAIVKLEVGPERVVAAAAAFTVDWNDRPPSGRRNKMFVIRDRVRGELWDFLHQMPEVLLVADDGVVAGVFSMDVGTKVA